VEDIKLIERTMAWMSRKQYRSKGRGTFWASEASASFTNDFQEQQTVGKCNRSVYYRIKGVTPTNLPSPQSEVIFLLGNMVENHLIDLWKQMGLWENNSVRWEDKPRNLSGEFDAILREGNRLYGVECKSFYGYYANKQILGHWEGRAANKRYVKGKPKDEHLMQAAIYADQTKGELEGFKLIYCSRDDNQMAEFNITIGPAREILINGSPDKRFTIEDVYTRYAKLGEALASGEMPPKDYTWKPNDETVERLFARGDISKSAYESHIDGKDKVSDFHCNYCNFKDYCHGPNSDTIIPNTPITNSVPPLDYLSHGGL
jgi:hypothetical protein